MKEFLNCTKESQYVYADFPTYNRTTPKRDLQKGRITNRIFENMTANFAKQDRIPNS